MGQRRKGVWNPPLRPLPMIFRAHLGVAISALQAQSASRADQSCCLVRCICVAGSLNISPARSSASTPSLASGSLLDEMASLGDAGSYDAPSTPLQHGAFPLHPSRVPLLLLFAGVLSHADACAKPNTCIESCGLCSPDMIRSAGSPAPQHNAAEDAGAGADETETFDCHSDGDVDAEGGGELDGSVAPEMEDRTPVKPHGHGHEGLRSPISFDSPAGKVGPTVIDLSDDQVNECPTQ